LDTERIEEIICMMKEKKFDIKGTMSFALNENDEVIVKRIKAEDILQAYSKDAKEEIRHKYYSPRIYHLIEGKDFVDMVETGCIIDDDGTLVNIFVDGFDSNLGLCEIGFCQGRFIVTKDVFLEICKKHEVFVNWAGK
jgi:hypothetical protein